MSLYYADTSAVIKLLVEQAHSKAFAEFYDGHADAEWASSALLRIELDQGGDPGQARAAAGRS